MTTGNRRLDDMLKVAVNKNIGGGQIPPGLLHGQGDKGEMVAHHHDKDGHGQQHLRFGDR